MHPHMQEKLPATAPERSIGRPRVSYVIDGNGPSWIGAIHKSPIMPIKLQRIMNGLGVSAATLAKEIKWPDGRCVSRSAISNTLNRGVIPGSIAQYKEQIEQFLRDNDVPDTSIETCWDRESNVSRLPVGTRPNINPKSQEDELIKEAEMLTPTTMRLFKLFKNPFIDDIRETSDIYMSESHRYAESAMLDAAHNGGFVAITGECGAGKSVLRRKLIHTLADDSVRVIYPLTIDKGLLTSGLILGAIINDLAPGTKVKVKNEDRARQVRDLLLGGSHAGMRHVLILEEAHDLSVPTMKQLKRLWEIEDGYRKVLGIIMIGQPELQMRLNRQTHPEMREVILRCLISELLPLDADLESYVALKFNRMNVELDTIFDQGWSDAVRQKLTSRSGQEHRSALYPLYINNLLAKSMNLAAECGESLVTPEIIMGA